MTSEPRTGWNAAVYDRINAPHLRWSAEIIEALALRGDEIVLDAGCGSGSVTRLLLEKLPRGHVYALDASAEMIAQFSESMRENGISNVTPIHASLTDFKLPRPVDVVFSNSVFHWIHDDAALFGSLFRATKPGGRLHAQFGADGALRKLHAAADRVREARFADVLSVPADWKKYRTAEETRVAVESAGWQNVRAEPLEQPFTIADPDAAAEFMATIVLRDYVSGLPDEAQRPFCREVVEQWERDNDGAFTIDYVRIELRATRPE